MVSGCSFLLRYVLQAWERTEIVARCSLIQVDCALGSTANTHSPRELAAAGHGGRVRLYSPSSLSWRIATMQGATNMARNATARIKSCVIGVDLLGMAEPSPET